ncbi:unnamed protein product [Caenorhabditis nigoni]
MSSLRCMKSKYDPYFEKTSALKSFQEIEEYLKTPPNPTIDPYEFWSGQKNLPMLKRLAVEYIAIPATSSESERLFSLSGLICSPKRSNLTSEKLDQLTFCSMNLKLLGINSVSDF